MGYAIQWLRSLLFNIQMYFMMAFFAVLFAPWAIFSREGAYRACRVYCKWLIWTAGWMIGLKADIRGEYPTDEVLIAAKHQSFFDVIMIVSVVPKPKFIMKKSLNWAPFLGWYGRRIGCVSVDRGKRAEAIRDMVAAVKSGDAPKGQLIIYPQGTRVAPDVKKPYKVGAAVLYEETGQDVVPVATNVGAFWPRHAVMRKPGVAVVEFLPRIKAGQTPRTFLKNLEETVETASDKLLDEAGFQRENS